MEKTMKHGLSTRRLSMCLLFGLCIATGAWAQTSKPTSTAGTLAREVAGSASGSVEKTRRLVDWLHQNLQWSYTDYQKRTVDQILTRRAGNCAELATVLQAMLDEAGVKSRWIAEINIHPVTPRRQATAAKKVEELGNRASVFGLRHNDHRWLEVFDDVSRSWVPADPSIGRVGVDAWVRARLAFSDRMLSPIADVQKVMRDMIAPIVVVAVDSRSSRILEDRSAVYLLDGFNALYGGKLSSLASWPRWKVAVEQLAVAGASAFEGRVNLHLRQALIDEAAEAYEALRHDAAAAGIGVAVLRPAT